MRPAPRLPAAREPNTWACALAEARRAGRPLLDLTESNPTAVGLGGAGPPELAALADRGGLRYEPDPLGLPAARAAVAAHHAARGHPVAPSHVVLTASTSEAYAHLFRLLTAPGDRVLVPSPSYPLVEPLAALEGVTVRPYRLVYEGRWRLDEASLARAIDGRTRAVVVVQPNNPTGSCLDAGEVARVEALCASHGLALISDEVFGEFPWPDAGPLPSLLGERAELTFVLGGLSKLCGMPQLKLAWTAVVGPAGAVEPALAGLEWIGDLFLSVATPVQLALPRLLAVAPVVQARVRERIAGSLVALRALVARRPEVELLRGDGGWSAVLRLPRVRSEEDWALELLRGDVVVHPGHFYDFEREAHIVVSLIAPQETLAGGLERLEVLVAAG